MASGFDVKREAVEQGVHDGKTGKNYALASRVV